MLIDLSHPLDNNAPVFPGDPKIEIISSTEDYTASEISFSLHTGTHVDAPAHFIPGGKKISDYKLENFFGFGKIIDVRGKNMLEKDLLDQIEINPGDIVLFYTGFDKFYGKQPYFENYPVMTEELAGELSNLDMKIIGFDSPSPDKHPFYIHKILLAKDILILENLTNLEALLSYSSFEILAMPLRIPAEASPVRVIAKI